MADEFDPVRYREVIAPQILRQQEAWMREASDSDEVIGNPAMAAVGDVVQLWMLGRADEANPILAHAIRRIALSTSRDEDFGDTEFWQSQRAATHALALWMAGESEPRELHEAAAERMLVALPLLAVREKLRELRYFAFGYLAEYLRSCVESDTAAAGCARYEAFLAAGKPEPAGSKLAYAYCCAVRDHGRVSKQAIAAGEKVLKNMGYRTWVQHGQWSTLGMWMTCVWGQVAGTSPLEVITSAYDFVPASVRERAASFLPLR
ncbi:hypothetical protein A7982_14016 [Minicystis rosea]|nr:hypothetical protein A7982_14016 [Minicystis rosea]